MNRSRPSRARRLTIRLIALLCMVALVLPTATYAQPSLASGCETGSLPSNDPRYPAAQLTLICMPADWNGQLVIYAHGYTSPLRPLALPDTSTADGQFVPDLLLALGFAFATTSYHKNGYAVEQGGNDINALLAHFKTRSLPRPLRKVYLVGGSEGALITTMLVERYPSLYDGGVALCGPIGGAPYEVKFLSDFRVVFDYFFPQVFRNPPAGIPAFGVANVPSNAYAFWDSYYKPAIETAIRSNTSKTNQLFAVTDAARLASDPINTAVASAQAILFYSVFAMPDLRTTAGGNPYDNRYTFYFGSSNDAALNLRVERVRGDSAARSYMNQFYQPTGNLQQPLVTHHTTLDPIVPFEHEDKYWAMVLQKGRLQNLVTLSVERFGHCNFTATEVIGAFSLLLVADGILPANMSVPNEITQARYQPSRQPASLAAPRN